MATFKCLWILLIFSLFDIYYTSPSEDEIFPYSQDDPDHLLTARLKRSWSAFQRGWRALLKGSRLFDVDNRMIIYEKHGTYDRAIEDFYSLNPSFVHQTHQGELYGKVGDVDILLMGRDPTMHDTFQAMLVIRNKQKQGLTGESRISRGMIYISDKH